MGELPAGLIRPTTRPETNESEEEFATPATDEPGGRDWVEPNPEIRQPKRRTRRAAPKGESRGRKIGLPDDVHDRLWQFAREKKITISAAAAGILDKNLPRYRIEREG